MKYIMQQSVLRPNMLEAVEELSGQKVRDCYQCGKCSAGCPIAADMDLPPNQVIRLVQLGLIDQALRSKTIRLCASCETCTTRCPREVDLAAVMDALRNIAIREGLRSPEWAVSFFNRTFLSILRRYGRVFEMELIGEDWENHYSCCGYNCGNSWPDYWTGNHRFTLRRGLRKQW